MNDRIEKLLEMLIDKLAEMNKIIAIKTKHDITSLRPMSKEDLEFIRIMAEKNIDNH